MNTLQALRDILHSLPEFPDSAPWCKYDGFLKIHSRGGIFKISTVQGLPLDDDDGCLIVYHNLKRTDYDCSLHEAQVCDIYMKEYARVCEQVRAGIPVFNILEETKI